MTTALTEIRTTPGLDPYLDSLEARLERAFEAYPGCGRRRRKGVARCRRQAPASVVVFSPRPKTAAQPLLPVSRWSCCTWRRSCTTT
jgi:hypothetical protein